VGDSPIGPFMRAGADHEAVTTVPVAEVATALERVINEP
jgi:hypothetical protein